MKRFLLFVFFLANFNLSAQEAIPLGVNSMINMFQYELSKKFGAENISIDDKIYIKNYVGSPLLLSKWSKAEALFNDGNLYTIPNVNYDALDDIFIIYLKNYKSEYDQFASEDFPLVSLTNESLIAIALSNNEDGTVRFVRVSPGHFINKSKTRFFQYFTVKPKDALILKSVYKKVRKNHMRDMPYTNNLDEYQFLTFDTYYIKNKDKFFTPVHLGKKAILKAIDDPSAEKALKKYIKTQHLKMKKPEDVQKLLEYYFKELRKSN